MQSDARRDCEPRPSARPRIVAVDIGNSAAKWATSGEDRSEQRVSLSVADWQDQLIRSAGGNGPTQWRIASVNRPMSKRLVASLDASGLSQSHRVLQASDVPIVAKVPCPDRVGIDRLLAAWQATKRFPGSDLVVIDAGSAITIDVVNSRCEFLGGLILPGLTLQFDSLARGTDALPQIDWRTDCLDDRSLPIPATGTITAIRSGILRGTAAAIDGLIDQSRTSMGSESASVLLSGGDGPFLARHLRTRHVSDARLVLDAILELP